MLDTCQDGATRVPNRWNRLHTQELSGLYQLRLIWYRHDDQMYHTFLATDLYDIQIENCIGYDRCSKCILMSDIRSDNRTDSISNSGCVLCTYSIDQSKCISYRMQDVNNMCYCISYHRPVRHSPSTIIKSKSILAYSQHVVLVVMHNTLVKHNL